MLCFISETLLDENVSSKLKFKDLQNCANSNYRENFSKSFVAMPK